METTYISIDRWMDKENMVDPYNGILFSLQTEGKPPVYNMYEPGEHEVKWNKPVTEGQRLHDSDSIENLR